MECLIRLKNRPKFIDAVEKFQLSWAYPVLFAILCTVSGVSNKYVYLPVISILALTVLFSVLFVRDKKVFITPIFMLYYSLGTDTQAAFTKSNGIITSSFDNDAFTGICILAAIIVIPFLLRFVLDGSLTLAFKERGPLFYGLVFINISVLIAGIFSEHWTPSSFLYSIFIVAGLDLFYIILYAIIKESYSLTTAYACRVLVLTCLVISAQIILLALHLHSNDMLLIQNEWTGRWVLQRELLAMSWGISTIIGAASALGIPAALYLAKNERFPIIYYISALLMFGVSVLVNTRSSMLVGGLFLFIGILIASFTGKNKRVNLVFSACLLFVAVCAGIAALAYFTRDTSIEDLWFKIYKFMRLDSVNDRLSVFKVGLRDFASSPILGVGWSKGGNSLDHRADNFYSNMYHCIVIQMAASTGVVGIGTLIFHVKDIFVMAFKRFSTDRVLLLSVPLMIFMMSFVDNFFFYLNFQIFYVAFLLVAQKDLDMTKNKTV